MNEATVRRKTKNVKHKERNVSRKMEFAMGKEMELFRGNKGETIPGRWEKAVKTNKDKTRQAARKRSGMTQT